LPVDKLESLFGKQPRKKMTGSSGGRYIHNHTEKLNNEEQDL